MIVVILVLVLAAPEPCTNQCDFLAGVRSIDATMTKEKPRRGRPAIGGSHDLRKP